LVVNDYECNSLRVSNLEFGPNSKHQNPLPTKAIVRHLQGQVGAAYKIIQTITGNIIILLL